MKKILTSALVLLCVVASAQPGYHGRPSGGRPGMGHGSYGPAMDIPVYWSILGGWNFSHIASDDTLEDASGTRTGSYVGLGVGFQMLPNAPVILNTGLIYSGKGGVSKLSGDDLRYNLGYLEVPVTFSYRMLLSPQLAVEPSFGVYFAGGVYGNVKDYTTRTSKPAFSDNLFRRFDSGLRLGCGVNYLIFHAALHYDLGIADICRDDFISAHNRTLSLALGFSF